MDEENPSLQAASTPRKALEAWRRRLGPGLPGALDLTQTDDGLINQTFFAGDPPSHVLQRVNPIFDRLIQTDIDTVTTHLTGLGWVTPRLVPTDDGQLDAPGVDGFWRLLTFIPGVTHHRLLDARMAAAVGGLVGRFHAALAEADLEMVAPPRRVHRTEVRLRDMEAALEDCDGHPLAGPARALGDEILEAWSRWHGDLDGPERLCHGDLKVSNIRFSADGAALCLLDLDTLGPQELSAEMGDAWRSWCNPAGEGDPESSRLDLELFEASALAWLRAAPPLEPAERENLVPGIERIALELAARFCADAVQNSYFQEDRRRFPRPGAHNLHKARSQVAFAASARAQRSACERGLRGVKR
ncbi:MAG: aminoglycoside phosphotransferase family protein [Acidobacteriota bacterium]